MSKENQQLKNIQKELEELSMDLHQAPLQTMRRQNYNAKEIDKNPADWFQADPDVWMPNTSRDPDVWPPPTPSDQRLVLCFQFKRIGWFFTTSGFDNYYRL